MDRQVVSWALNVAPLPSLKGSDVSAHSLSRVYKGLLRGRFRALVEAYSTLVVITCEPSSRLNA